MYLLHRGQYHLFEVGSYTIGELQAGHNTARRGGRGFGFFCVTAAAIIITPTVTPTTTPIIHSVPENEGTVGAITLNDCR